MTQEQIYSTNMSKLKSKNCTIYKKGKNYFMRYYGKDEKLPKDWLDTLQLNIYNIHFEPSWLLADGEQAGNAIMREIDDLLS